MELGSHPIRISAIGLGLATAMLSGIAQGEEPHFGPHDIPTIFYISKSDDHNRVDYGMRLGDQCTPLSNAAVFPYWREFEHAPPVRTHPLGMFEYFAYGISEQHTVRGSTPVEYVIKLKQFGQRPIWVTTKREANGQCSAVARCAIAGVRFAELFSIYVKLSGPLSVEYVIVKGRDLETGKLIEERLKK
ncbi:MAG TPA: DUF4833 domain-containing protein [Polyangiaceae bacterium]|jgi:hypothetical protein|nr:DUF4833 domain-containing protein [Polyangiaceae bacterium]